MAPSFLRPRDRLIHSRGARRHDGPDASDRLREALARRPGRTPDHEIAPGVAYPADLWTRHVLIAGSVGSGKSTALRPLIARVVASGERALLFDPKGEFTSAWDGPEIVAPWDARGLAWDLARDMRNIQDMRRFAASIVRESADPMWSSASREILVGLLWALRKERGSAWGWEDLAASLRLPRAEMADILLRWRPQAARLIERESATSAGVLVNLGAFCAPIFDLAEAWGESDPERRIGFRDWALGRDPRAQIVLQAHGAYAELSRAYVEAIVGALSALVVSPEMPERGRGKLWLIADEFARMGKLPAVRELFEVGRSKNVRCVVAVQDIAQIEEVYGPLMAKSLAGLCGTRIVGQMMPGESAKAACEALGSREVERPGVSVSDGPSGRSSTRSFSRDQAPLYLPSELASRLGMADDGSGVRMALATGGEVYELFWPRFDMPEARPAFVPAAWTLGPDINLGEPGAGSPPAPWPIHDIDRASDSLAAPADCPGARVDVDGGVDIAHVEAESGDVLLDASEMDGGGAEAADDIAGCESETAEGPGPIDPLATWMPR